jgi:hypothetical protein
MEKGVLDVPRQPPTRPKSPFREKITTPKEALGFDIPDEGAIGQFFAQILRGRKVT